MIIAIMLLTLLMAVPMTVTAAPPSEAYQLVWADEFEGTVLNLDNWGFHHLGPRRDAVNVKDCASLDGKGNLVLTTRHVGEEYQTAMVETRGKFEACYGYFECRVKLQTQLGHWSAFWLMSPKFRSGGNPKENGTEIDIYEYLVKEGKTVFSNLHWGGYDKEFHKTTGSKYELENTPDGYHIVGLEWTPDEYVIFFDGKEAWRTKEAISHIEEYIILSLEVGEWAGDIKEAALPDSVLYDYVRVYQKEKEPSIK